MLILTREYEGLFWEKNALPKDQESASTKRRFFMRKQIEPKGTFSRGKLKRKRQLNLETGVMKCGACYVNLHQ